MSAVMKGHNGHRPFSCVLDAFWVKKNDEASRLTSPDESETEHLCALTVDVHFWKAFKKLTRKADSSQRRIYLPYSICWFVLIKTKELQSVPLFSVLSILWFFVLFPL